MAGVRHFVQTIIPAEDQKLLRAALLGVPPALQRAPETGETNNDGYSGKVDGQSESSAHGEGNLGGDRG